MDFTLSTYDKLLNTLISQGFSFLPVRSFKDNFSEKHIVLRHDVDASPLNSLIFAKVQHEFGIVGSYYFRIFPGKNQSKIITQIASLGHEIGYHYEDVSRIAQRTNKKIIDETTLLESSIDNFYHNLAKLREFATVRTICMHGSPLSPWDSRLLWKNYDYHDFGISFEPYFDINVEDMLYLSDTGRRWDGNSVSVRDKFTQTHQFSSSIDPYRNWKVKPASGSLMNMNAKSISFQNKFEFKSSFNIIEAAQLQKLPIKMLMTFHPQRWSSMPFPWIKELLFQNTKNIIKYFLIKMNA